eukprot:GGOE01000376.1.p1 GENE.GGOE01000376.1~~GGOE01000376.1.p1  ORF type:complete len:458 (-),score=60.07 GGOE01000376.1:158-1531(-)
MFRADALKEEGNNHYQQRKFKEAIKCYTEALKLKGPDAILLCNRSAAHLGDGNPKASLLDAHGAIDLKPRWSKAHFRLAKALAELNRHADAHNAMQRACMLAPDDEAIQKALAEMDCLKPVEEMAKPTTAASNPPRTKHPPSAKPPPPPPSVAGGAPTSSGVALLGSTTEVEPSGNVCCHTGAPLRPVFTEVTWNDGDHLLMLMLSLPYDTQAKDLEIKVTAGSIAVKDWRARHLYLDKEFAHKVDPSEDSIDWVIDRDSFPGKSILRITLRKDESFKHWETLFKGDPFRKGYSTFSDEHKYEWHQTDEEVLVQFPLPAGCDHRTLAVEFKLQHLRVTWPGHPPLMDRPLLFPIKVSESLWSVCSGKLEVTLTKREKCKVWCSVTVDGPEVAPQSALVEMIQDPDAEKCSYGDLGPEGQHAVDVMRRYETAKVQNDEEAISRAEFELEQLSFCLSLR